MAVLPTVKGSQLTKNILPSLPSLSRRAVWHEQELQYDGREPPKAWLARLRQLKQIYGYNEKETLKIAKKCLKGDAKLWLRIHQPQSFSSLRTGLHTRFASGPVASAVKPSLPAPRSQGHVDYFLSDLPLSLPSKLMTPSKLSNVQRSRSKLSNGEKSDSVRSVGPSKHSSRGRSVSVRSLIQPKSFSGESCVCIRSVTPSKQPNRERYVSAKSMTHIKLLNGESSVSGKPITRVEKSSVPSALCNSKEISCKPESKKQAGGPRSCPKLDPSDETAEDKRCVPVPQFKVGFAKCTSESGKAYDKISGSIRKVLDSDSFGSDSGNQTSRSMDSIGDSSLNKNMDTFSLSSLKLLFPLAVIRYLQRRFWKTMILCHKVAEAYQSIGNKTFCISSVQFMVL